MFSLFDSIFHTFVTLVLLLSGQGVTKAEASILVMDSAALDPPTSPHGLELILSTLVCQFVTFSMIVVFLFSGC